MPWGFIDDQLHDHPKVVKAGNEAMGVWTRCLSYAREHGSNGFVPLEYVQQCAGGVKRSRAVIARLLNCRLHAEGKGLWTEAEGGYQFHDFSDIYGDKEHSNQVSTARAEAGRRGARARWGAIVKPMTDLPTDDKHHGKPNGKLPSTLPSDLPSVAVNGGSQMPSWQTAPTRAPGSGSGSGSGRDPEEASTPLPARVRVGLIGAWDEAGLPPGPISNSWERGQLEEDLRQTRGRVPTYPTDAQICTTWKALVDGYGRIGITMPPTPAKLREHLGTVERVLGGEITVEAVTQQRPRNGHNGTPATTANGERRYTNAQSPIPHDLDGKTREEP